MAQITLNPADHLLPSVAFAQLEYTYKSSSWDCQQPASRPPCLNLSRRAMKYSAVTRPWYASWACDALYSHRASCVWRPLRLCVIIGDLQRQTAGMKVGGSSEWQQARNLWILRYCFFLCSRRSHDNWFSLGSKCNLFSGLVVTAKITTPFRHDARLNLE